MFPPLGLSSNDQAHRPMHFKNFSAAVFGIDAYLMEVEVDVGSGKPGDFNVVGLPLALVSAMQ